ADVVAHPARTGREQGQIDPALTLEPKLVGFEAFAQLVVGDVERALLADVGRIVGDGCLLGVAVPPQLWRGGRVVAVAVDDHAGAPPAVTSCSARNASVRSSASAADSA